MRVVTYSRVSTSHHEQKPEVQLEELRRYSVARGWEITHEIVDHGFSGGTDKRPGLKNLLSLVRARKVDAVVVLKLDRLFRSLKHLLATLEEFNALGIQFIAVADQVDCTTAAGRLFISILGSLSEFEKELCRERTLLGLAHAKSKGKVFGRPVKHSRGEILALHSQGLSYREIQARTGAPAGCVARAIKTARKSGLNFQKSQSSNSGGCKS